MWTAWGVLGMIQLMSSRYLKMYWYFNMWIHRITGTIILILTFTFAIMAINQNDGVISKSYHAGIGITILCLVTLVAFGGITTRILLNRLTWKTKLALIFKRFH